MSLLSPREVIEKKFKDFILDPLDINPHNLMMLMKKELLIDQITHDFYHLTVKEYCIKYCGGCSESERVKAAQTSEATCAIYCSFITW